VFMVVHILATPVLTFCIIGPLVLMCPSLVKWECGADIVTKVESFHIGMLFILETFIFINDHFIGLGHF